ncbi:MAG: helix-turn-helix transcriptional regulator [Clostridia bacterium]|nr:helix-turn-helix transcriptional regulator [Clostridia bacterium]
MDRNLNWEIGMRIKQARERAHITQEKLAEILDCSPQYVSFMETGRHLISIKMLRKLCSALGISSDSILFTQKRGNRLDIIGSKCANLTDRQFDLLTDIVDCYIKAIESSSTETKV